MKLLAILMSLVLTLSASSQQSAESRPGILLHGDEQGRGAIRGVVIGRNGERAGHTGVMVFWLCPKGCQIVTSSMMTNGVGEFQFDPITGGKYIVCSDPDAYSQLPCFMDAAVGAVSCIVEITPEHPTVELRMQVPKRGTTPPKPHDHGDCRQNVASLH